MRKIKIGIIINNPQETSLSVKLLSDYIKKTGNSCLLICPAEIDVAVDKDKFFLIKEGKIMKSLPHVVINRQDVTICSPHDIQIVRELQLKKIPILNPPEKANITHDKFLVNRKLMMEGIPMSKMARICANSDLKKIAEFLGFPIVLKGNKSNQGKEVILVSNFQELKSFHDFLINSYPQKDFFLQEFVKEAGNNCIRSVVVDHRVVINYGRKTQGGEFRANLKLGKFGGFIKVKDYEEKILTKISKILDLDILGVDWARTKNGMRIIEVNAYPGLGNLYKQTKFDLSPFIINLAIKKIRGE